MTLEDTLFHSPAAEQWKRIQVTPHHGIALPLFSLHSEKSSGIGEYLDLLPLIDWCVSLGFDVIQLLPLNDIGRAGSPYGAISAFALNPLHLSLHALAHLEKLPEHEQLLSELKALNQTDRVDYATVYDKKNRFLRAYYAVAFPEFEANPDFKKFIATHKWLESYALFKSIKESQNWTSWEMWPTSLKSPSSQSYRELLEKFKKDATYHILLQYLCFKQLSLVKEQAMKKHLLLKGDIPILVNRDSADVWAYRQNFHLHLAAGAPPDAFSREGQCWGFPLYDWEFQAQDHYHFWKERLRVASEFYHLYRIDHIVGFFRIWGVPLGKKAIQGSYFPPKESEWISHGKKLMEMMLKACPMLPIGEDLGTVPPEVRICLKELGICGTKMMRWERRWEEEGRFISPSEYDPVSMSTVSTHDTDTLQLWWKHAPKEAKLFSEFKKWTYEPFLSFDHHQEILYDSHHSSSLFHINLLHEYFALFPELISPNSQAERINTPSQDLPTNWTYRFRKPLEYFTSFAPLQEAIKTILK